MGSILVTGVDAGIGLAASLDLSSRGHTVYGVAPNQTEADRISSQTRNAFCVIAFDLHSQVEMRSALHHVEDKLCGEGLSAVIHCGSLAIVGPLTRIPVAEVQRQMEMEVIGSLTLARAALPLLRLNNPDPGRFIQVGSLSAQHAFPFLGARAMSQHAIRAMLDALRVEWMRYGVPVCDILPGKLGGPIAQQIMKDLRRWKSDPDFGPMAKNFAREYQRRQNVPLKRLLQALRHAAESPAPRPRYVLRNGMFSDSILIKLFPEHFTDQWIFRRLSGGKG